MFFFSKPYIAVIGDIKGSKKILDRNAVQLRLQDTLHMINETYEGDIASKFMVTLGDEFQGLLGKGSNAMYMISEIERRMYPVKIRFGIGVGAITTQINRDMAIGADGPGYYKAREAIEILRLDENKKQAAQADIRIAFEGENQREERLLNTIFELLTAIKEAWSERQREVISDMQKHQDGQIHAAVRLKVQQSTIQRILAKGNYYTYKEALNTIGMVLEEIGWGDV